MAISKYVDEGNFYSNTGKQRKYDNFTDYLFLKLQNRKCDIRKGQKIKKGVASNKK